MNEQRAGAGIRYVGARYSRKIKTIFLLCVMYCASIDIITAQSQTSDAESSAAPQQKSMVDDVHDGVSDSVLTTAAWLDSFFDDRRFEAETNKSRLKLSLTTFAEEGDLLGFDFTFRLRLALPRLENKWNLIVSGDPDDDPSFDDQEQRNIRTNVQEGRTEGGVAALQYFIKSARDINISFQAGLRLNGFTPVAFLGPRYRKSIALDDWTLRFTQRVRWFTDDGWDSNTAIDLERPLSERLFFRASTEGSWSQVERGYFYNFRTFLAQPFSERRSLVYEWNNFFQTEPNNHLEETNLRLHYRQNIWRQWMFIDVAPQIAFLNDRDYDVSPGIIFRLEMLFGYYDEG
jgi:hypothetical protein